MKSGQSESIYMSESPELHSKGQYKMGVVSKRCIGLPNCALMGVSGSLHFDNSLGQLETSILRLYSLNETLRQSTFDLAERFRFELLGQI